MRAPTEHPAGLPHRLPDTVSELIQQLDALNPEPRVTVGFDREQAIFEAGRRSVVEQLLNLKRKGSVPA